MDKTEEHGEHLNSDVAASVSQNMERLLRDVFQLMFKLNLAVAPTSSFDPKDAISANLVLRHEKVTACISFRILRSTAQIIAERIGMGKTADLSLVLQQDVACEIVNIVGNNLRTVLSEDLGVHFDFDIANVTTNVDVQGLEYPIVFNMDFQLSPEAPISLGFICGNKPDVTEPSTTH